MNKAYLPYKTPKHKVNNKKLLTNAAMTKAKPQTIPPVIDIVLHEKHRVREEETGAKKYS